MVKFVQGVSFQEEQLGLQGIKKIGKSSRLVKLRPILVEGVLRVGGRLENAPTLSRDERHPIILPGNHHVSKLLMRHYHECLAHCGRELLAESRKMYWIVGGRSIAKKTVRDCIRCRRLNAKPMEQIMAPLPEERLTPYKPPFTFSGVDFFGPLQVRWGRGTVKRWGCIFTCRILGNSTIPQHRRFHNGTSTVHQ